MQAPRQQKPRWGHECRRLIVKNEERARVHVVVLNTASVFPCLVNPGQRTLCCGLSTPHKEFGTVGRQPCTKSVVMWVVYPSQRSRRCGSSTLVKERSGLSTPCRECRAAACKPSALQLDMLAAPHGVVIKNWKGCSLESEDGLRCYQ